MESMRLDMDQERIIEMPEFEVKRIADKLGYGEGTISHVDRTDVTSETFVDDETLQAVETAIASEAILVEVDEDKDGQMIDDDGCGDGRGVRSIVEGTETRHRSLNRPKVFGGGTAMAAAAEIGLGHSHGKTLLDTFKSGMDKLMDKRIGFGGHTDEHAKNGGCGCGAIDKAPQAVANAVKYESDIRGTISTLGIDSTYLDEVFAEYRAYSDEIADDTTYTGASVMEEILDNGKVVKKLADDHYEMYIVLNAKHGYTVSQELVRQVSDGKVQVFGVDVWRMQDIANRLYETQEERQKAFLSELVYTLAVAPTLTKGDLPVYMVSDSLQHAA